MNSLDFREAYSLLLDQEVAEASFKYASLRNFLGLKPATLDVAELEGSYVCHSSESSADFRTFNFARIQNTSAAGLGQIWQILNGRSNHLLATAPLGLDESFYEALESLRYHAFASRSVLVRSVTEQEPSPTSAIVKGYSFAENESEVLSILNSHTPYPQADFERSYSSWLRENSYAQLFLAHEEDEPIGMGLLSWYNNTGILSSGVVTPSQRGRGLQKLLIQSRIQKAKELGLKMLFAPGVPPFSASEASLRSCGFEVLCTRMFWKLNS